MNMRDHSVCIVAGKPADRGFTLVELMIAMLLGLIVIAGVSSVFVANLRSYNTSVALSGVQSNARIAFELMARDIRQAGLTGCNSKTPRIANVLNSGPHKNNNAWWANWTNVVHGYGDSATDPAVTTGTATAQRVAGTDSLELLGATGSVLTVLQHNPSASSFTVDRASNYLADGDVIIVCDPDHATILQINTAPVSNTTLGYATGSQTPGNCSTGLGFPTVCTTSGTAYQFALNGRPAKILKLGAHGWYIGTNPAGTRSLYRITEPGDNAQEMVRNVRDMQITYHEGSETAFTDASGVNAWANVDAIRVTLTVQSAEARAGTDGNRLIRSFSSTTTIRNRT